MNYLKTLTDRLRRNDSLADELDDELSKFKPEPDTRTILERTAESTLAVIGTYNDRRIYLENKIAAAQEELRQVNIVIEGATRMHETLTGGN